MFYSVKSSVNLSIYKYPLLLLIFLFFAAASHSVMAADFDVEWTEHSGAGISQDVDSEGNVYIAGRIFGTYPGQTSAGGTDILIQKFDSSGNEIWARQFGSPEADAGIGVAFNGSNVYIVGYADGALTGQTSSGLRDAFVRKYDSDGNEVWTRQYGSAGNDEAISVVVYGSDIYITGSTDGELPGQTSSGDTDAYVRKYDSSGNVSLTLQFGTDGGDDGRGIAVDSSGIFVSGMTMDGEFPGQTNAGDCDAYVIKYDSSGSSVLWVDQFGTEECDGANRIVVDSSGVYTAGLVEDALPGTNVNDVGDFVRKYDTNGNVIWTEQCGGEEAHSISVDTDMVYIVGYTHGALPGKTNLGSADAFICAYNTNGEQEWTDQFGTSIADSAYGVQANGASVYVVGMDFSAFITKYTQDIDSDVIFSEIDVQPSTYSNDFNDGTSSGTISTRGDQTLIIKDALNTSSGVSIIADPSGGAAPAQVSSCNGSVNSSLDAGDSVVVTCGSVTIDIVNGTVENTFFADDGTEASVNLPEGNSITFDPVTNTFTAPLTNTETIIITVNGTDTSLEPGAAVVIEVSDDEDGDGVLDEVDFCPATVLPDEVPTRELKPKHYADTDGDGIFEVGPRHRDSRFTLEDTAGCTCAQIIDALPGKKKGLKKFGCSRGIMKKWIRNH